MDALHQTLISFLYLEKYTQFKKLSKYIKNKKTVRYVSETISYRTPLLRANLPEKNKLTNSLSEFKSKIKTRKCGTCRSSSCPDVIFKKGVLKNLAKFTGKHLFQSLFFIKVAGLRLETFLKKTPWIFLGTSNNTFSYWTPTAATSVHVSVGYADLSFRI